MSLESQLSLSKNGGVYYNKTRISPTDDPVLIVGIGGTGIDAMLYVKNEVQCRMQLPTDRNGKVLNNTPLNISFLAVDTDKEVLNKTRGVASIRETSGEFVDLRVPGLPGVISRVVQKDLNKPEWNWYDPDMTANGGVDGANGVRQIGRFMLFYNMELVIGKLKQTITTVIQNAQMKSNNLKVYILGEAAKLNNCSSVAGFGLIFAVCLSSIYA